MDIFNIVSEQSTARPGCIIQLDAILDATNDWQNTQFLHVFQEALILGEKYSKKRKYICDIFSRVFNEVLFILVAFLLMIDINILLLFIFVILGK